VRSLERARAVARRAVAVLRLPVPAYGVPPAVLGAVAAAWVAQSRPPWQPAMIAVALVGMACLMAGLLSSRSGPVAVAMAVWGGGFVLSLAGHRLDALGAAVFGTVLFAVFEMSSWAAATVPRTPFPPGARRPQLVAGAGCALGGFGLAWAIGLTVGVGWGTSLVLAAGGGLGALLAIGLIALGILRPEP
jgi:hypothetical protein